MVTSVWGKVDIIAERKLPRRNQDTRAPHSATDRPQTSYVVSRRFISPPNRVTDTTRGVWIAKFCSLLSASILLRGQM